MICERKDMLDLSNKKIFCSIKDINENRKENTFVFTKKIKAM